MAGVVRKNTLDSISRSVRSMMKKDKDKNLSLHPLIEQKDVETLKHIFKEVIPTQKKAVTLLNLDRDENGDLPIHLAMRSDNTEIIRLFFDYYKRNANVASINAGDKNGYTPLHLLVSNNELPDNHIFIKELLTDFPDLKVDAVNEDKNTSLHYLCAKYNNPHAPEIGEMIIKKIGPSIVNATNKQGETPLHKSIFNPQARLLLVDMLLSHGADVNKVNDKSESCLHYAVRLGRRDLISRLVIAGADISIKGSDNKTPLELSTNPTITSYLEKIQALVDWSRDQEIEEEYVLLFIREEVFLDLIVDLDDSMLDSLKINKIGARKKLVSAAQKLKVTPVTTNSGIVEAPQVSAKLRNPLDEDELDVEECASLDSAETADLENSLKTVSNGQIVDVTQNWILHSELEFLKKLGEGVSGKVFQGIYKKQSCAIKVLKSRGDVSEFKKEFLIISSVKSPYIVKFFGACLTPQIAMVMEFCNGGSLLDVLNRVEISWNLFFKMSNQICNAVNTLHTWTPQILHRDLKSLNLLANDKCDLFLADFGLSRFETESNADTLMKTCGTVTYCAPEILAGKGKYTIKADVYSIAFILWEIVVKVMTGVYQRPYGEYPDMVRDIQFLRPVCEDHLRPTLPKECPVELRNLITESWSPDIDKRPTTKELLERLEKANATFKANESAWNSIIRNK